MPSVSILAEPPVAVVDKVVEKKGTRAIAEAYLKFIYSPGGPGNFGQEFLSPSRSCGCQEVRKCVPEGKPVHRGRCIGGWRKAQETHFKDGGVFDAIYTN